MRKLLNGWTLTLLIIVFINIIAYNYYSYREIYLSELLYNLEYIQNNLLFVNNPNLEIKMLTLQDEHNKLITKYPSRLYLWNRKPVFVKIRKYPKANDYYFDLLKQSYDLELGSKEF